MSHPLDTAKIKVLSEEINEDTSRNQTTVTMVYMVTASSPAAALTAPDVPQPGDFHYELTDLPLNRRTVLQPDGVDNTDGSTRSVYHIRCDFGFTSGGTGELPPRPAVGEPPRAIFTSTLTGQRIEVDSEDGKKVIGNRYYHFRNAGSQVVPLVDPETGFPVVNDEAELGADVLVPQISLQVNMPPATDAPDLSILSALVGTVNDSNWTFGANPATSFPGWTLTAETVLYQGYQVEQLEANRYGVTHNFLLGLSQLPQGAPLPFTPGPGFDIAEYIKDWDGTIWTSQYLPIRYGIYTVFQRAEDVSQGPSGEEIRYRTAPIQFRVFRRYRAATFALLGIP